MVVATPRDLRVPRQARRVDGSGEPELKVNLPLGHMRRGREQDPKVGDLPAPGQRPVDGLTF